MLRRQLFINGEFTDALSGETLPTLNPHDNSVIADVALAGREDVDRAVVRPAELEQHDAAPGGLRRRGPAGPAGRRLRRGR